ncbi:MAG: SGNH/GDSL hydrolase family protein [Clostridia bacterium]|nr:SGNH/GDSL hydrolase family protein [Clostridia bacterium]
MKLEGKKVFFLGDSITEGVGASCSENCYVSVMERKYGIKAFNYGVSGTRLAIQSQPTVEAPAYDETFCERAKRMEGEPDIIVVFGGTNDFGHGDAPFGDLLDDAPYTFCGACRDLFTYLQKRYPLARIIVCTPAHRADELNPRGDGLIKRYNVGTLKAYADAIRKIAEDHSLPVCDLYRNLGINVLIPEHREALMPDGLHPNDAGHERLADCIASFIQSL